MALFLNYFRKKSTNHQEDPRLEKIRAFHSIVSILAQIQQGPPFGDREYADGKPPNIAEQARLKLSNAFAHLAVSSTEVAAATLYAPDELVVLTWIQDQNPGDKPGAAQDTQKDPKSKWQSIMSGIYWLLALNTPNEAMRPGNTSYHAPSIVKAAPPADYPKDDSKEALLQYLDDFPTKKWKAPNEVSHLWLLTKMLTTLKGDQYAYACAMKYVITVSHKKIIRRFETDSSKDYWKSFESVGSNDLCSAIPKRDYRDTEVGNDLSFLAALKGGVIDYAQKYPNIAKKVEDLPNLERPGTLFEIFDDTTCEEYHHLFMGLMEQYKAFVEEIATAATDEEPFGDKLDPIVETGYTILTMVEGRAFHRYLSTIASKLSKSLAENSRIRAIKRAAGGRDAEGCGAEERGAEGQDAEDQDVEEQDVEVGMTLWDPIVEADTAAPLWKPFKSWIMLMLVHFDAADALCNFVDLVPEISKAEIGVKIVYSPVISDATIPLEDLMTKYIPASGNSQTDAKLLDFIKAARKVQRQAKCINSFSRKWGPKRVPAAIAFLQEVLAEVQSAEHDSEDSADSEDEAHRKATIADLATKTIELLSQPTHDASVIVRKFWTLKELMNLQERQAGYKFVDKSTFTGALHCEAGLASILDKTTREHIQARIDALKPPDGTWKRLTDSEEQLHDCLLHLLKETEGLTRVIGISKRCCPVCRRFLALLSTDGNPRKTGFIAPGFHNTITRCTLPEWTPEVWVDAMNATFGPLLRKELVKLSEEAGSLNSYKNRRQSSGSGVSVGTTIKRRRGVIKKAQA